MMMDALFSALDWTVAQRHDSERNIISNNNNRLLFVHNLAQPQSHCLSKEQQKLIIIRVRVSHLKV